MYNPYTLLLLNVDKLDIYVHFKNVYDAYYKSFCRSVSSFYTKYLSQLTFCTTFYVSKKVPAISRFYILCPKIHVFILY